jgi:hypothetical protein
MRSGRASVYSYQALMDISGRMPTHTPWVLRGSAFWTASPCMLEGAVDDSVPMI